MDNTDPIKSSRSRQFCYRIKSTKLSDSYLGRIYDQLQGDSGEKEYIDRFGGLDTEGIKKLYPDKVKEKQALVVGKALILKKCYSHIYYPSSCPTKENL